MKTAFNIILFLAVLMVCYLLIANTTNTSYSKSILEPPYQLTHVIGHSMEQYGIHDNDYVKVYEQEPKIGDIVSFTCTGDGTDCPKQRMIKRLVDKKDDCYWVQGNDEPWVDEHGQPKRSMDSRVYGWLCRGDFVLNGVVKP